MREHFVPVTRTARYLTLGDPAAAAQIWFVCHGYRQLASRFIRYFAALDDGKTCIIAPEGLSRFYLDTREGEHGPGDKVGASWMTREDRLNEINDYVRFLDQLYDNIFDTTDRAGVDVFALGFSQGVATVCRWVDADHARIDHTILWGSFIPPDVDLAAGDAPLKQTRMTLVFGHDDEIATAERMREQESRLAQHHVEYEMVRFDGGHHLNQFVLKGLAAQAMRRDR
jgi:predicted esterase